MFGKKRALAYPVRVVVAATGAPAGAMSTKKGVLVFSVATGGCYCATNISTTAAASMLLVTTATTP